MGPLAPAKLDQLRGLLASLPGDMARRLCDMAAQADPALGRLLGNCLFDPDDLARERFFAPIAPLSGEPGSDRPAVSAAPVGLLRTLWTWMGEDLAPDIAVRARAAALDPAAPDRPGQLDPDRAAFARLMLDAFKHAEQDPRALKRLKTRLGVERFDEARDIAAMLRLAPVLRTALNGLAPVIHDPDDAQCVLIRDRYEAAAAADPDAGPWVLLLIMARFSRPWRILRVFERLTHRDDDLLVGRTDMALIGDVLLRDAAHHLAGFRAAPRSETEARAAAAALTAFAAITVGMSREIGIRKDGPWGKRIMDLRTRASEQMTAIHDASRRAVGRVLPEADKTRRRYALPREEDMEQAQALCMFLALTRDDAGRAAVGSAHNGVIAELANAFEHAGQGALDALRSPDESHREAGAARLHQIAGLMQALGQGEAGAVLLRRGAAALAA
ncbi:hypothetical protein L2D01_06945 [Hyphomonadaceae bacterium ML37]|nr:hypothetical protein L2D01_06945 [Hyphomonadaceae bacterium ML37]